MISKAQKTLLHVAKAQLQLDDETYRSLLKAEASVTSSNDLDNAGLNRVLNRLTKLGFTNTAHRSRRRPATSAGALRTDAQAALIKSNYTMLGWLTTAQCAAFNKRSCGKSWPQTRTEATKIIVGQERYAATVIERWSGTRREVILHDADAFSAALSIAITAASGDAEARATIERAGRLLACKHRLQTVR